MADQFKGGICRGNFWNMCRDFSGSSPCSISRWSNNQELFITDINSSSRSSDNSTVSDGNIPQDVWNQELLFNNDRSEENYSGMLQESATCLSTSTIHYSQQANLMDCPRIVHTSSQGPSTITPQINSISDRYTSSSLLHSLLDPDSQPGQFLLENQGLDYSSEISSTFHEYESPMLKPSCLKIQPVNKYCPFTSKTISFDETARICPSYKPSTREPQFLPSSLDNKIKASQDSLGAKKGEIRDLGSVAKKAGNETAVSKRPRVETPSSLPIFKVRKEKLGDRVTALQQLVSPFGKTDTASVLHEAIEYIKFLHDQVSALSAPYLKNETPRMQHHRQATHHSNDDHEDGKNLQDLKSLGLCLVPISSTFPVAAETTADFWTPTFGQIGIYELEKI